ncbi:MAG TPA: RluA family pseudouridine synthase [Cytophagales bacterium]|nr:RluA family pseudouridine synthase [Cytophagales bacterium]
MEKITVLPAATGMYLVDFLLQHSELFTSRNAAKKAHKQQRVLVNDRPQGTGYRVHAGDTIVLKPAQGPAPKPYFMELAVPYQDDDVAVVYKPPGLPTSGNAFRTLQNVLVHALHPSPLPDALPWPRPVHRLDGPTQGLLMVARTHKALTQLGHSLADRQVHKVYHAVVHGMLTEAQECHKPIQGQSAHSSILPLATYPNTPRGPRSLVRLTPHTGRTHQLRIHLAALGHPILGDVQYQPAENTLQHKGLFLAATRLEFPHPRTGNTVWVEVPVPKKFERFLEQKPTDNQ